jgi:hypothetical protein
MTKQTQNQINIHVSKYLEGMEGQEIITINRAKFNLDRAFDQLRKEQILKLDAGLAREEAIDIITPFHFTTGAKQFSVPGMGHITAYTGQSKRFDKTRMATYLVEHGVSAGLVEEAMEHANRVVVNSKLTVKYKDE